MKTMGVQQKKTQFIQTHTKILFTSLDFYFIYFFVIFAFFSLVSCFLVCVLFGRWVDDFRNRRIYWDSSNCGAAVTDLYAIHFFIHLSIYFILFIAAAATVVAIIVIVGVRFFILPFLHFNHISLYLCVLYIKCPRVRAITHKIHLNEDKKNLFFSGQK